jgi:F-type H+-transporting ATPase subunit delta
MAGLSVRYATALFELAKENGSLDESLPQAVFLRDTLKDPDCQRIVSHPHISAAEKMDFFNKTFAGYVNEDLLGLICLAVAKDRESFLVPALSAYIDMVNRYKRQTTAQVISASPLSEGQVNALKDMLSGKLDKKVDVTVKIDPNVIGGLTIYVDGFMVDSTLKKRFYDMEKELKAV